MQLADAMVMHLPSFRADTRRTSVALRALAACLLAVAPFSAVMFLPLAVMISASVTTPSWCATKPSGSSPGPVRMTETVTVTADSV